MFVGPTGWWVVGFRVDRLFTGLCCGQGHLLIILISSLAGASANVYLVCYYFVEITRCIFVG